MQYRKAGASELRVSTLCLGTMMFGDQTDAKRAGEIVAPAGAMARLFRCRRLPITDYQWTAEDEALIDQHVAPGQPSSPGFTDQQYPLTGRPQK